MAITLRFGKLARAHAPHDEYPGASTQPRDVVIPEQPAISRAEPNLAGTFLGAPTLLLLWSPIGVTAVLLMGIHALDPEQDWGFPASNASNTVRIACGIGLWAAYSIRFACTGPISARIPASKVTVVFILMIAIGLSGLAILFAPLALVRIGLSLLPRGVWRTLAFVMFSAVVALATLFFMEFWLWLLKVFVLP